MDVHPTKNVSIGIDPIPIYDMQFAIIPLIHIYVVVVFGFPWHGIDFQKKVGTPNISWLVIPIN